MLGQTMYQGIDLLSIFMPSFFALGCAKFTLDIIDTLISWMNIK